ncbi:MAG: hypothetical protein MJE77_04140 [Proteobacteria bacterium]|nr:hypothetical protein [Pseudomonadota bacterium]
MSDHRDRRLIAEIAAMASLTRADTLPIVRPGAGVSRAGLRLDDLKGELRRRRPLLEKPIDGLAVPDELIETAALDTHPIEPWDTNRALGIVQEPFLRDYCAYFYVHLLQPLSTR